MISLSDREKNVNDLSTRLDTVSAVDGRTYRRTDGRTDVP